MSAGEKNKRLKSCYPWFPPVLRQSQVIGLQSQVLLPGAGNLPKSCWPDNQTPEATKAIEVITIALDCPSELVTAEDTMGSGYKPQRGKAGTQQAARSLH